MARYVIFPGTAGSFADTPDVNLLDADTAHVQQSIGDWSSQGATLGLSQDVSPLFGDFTLKVTLAAEFLGTPTGTAAFPILSNTEYTAAVDLQFPVARDGTASDNARIYMQWFDAGGLSLGTTQDGSNNAFAADTWGRLSNTATSPATAVFCKLTVKIIGTFSGVVVYLDEASLRAGSDGTFIPSLRIVGVADTTADYAPVVWTGVGGDQSITYFGEEIIHTIRSSSRLNFSYPGSVAATRIPTVPLIDGTRHTIRWYSDPAAGFKVFIDSVFEADIGAAYTPDFSGIGAPPNSAWAIGGRPRAGITPMTGDVWSVTQRDGIDGPIVAVFDAEDIGL